MSVIDHIGRVEGVVWNAAGSNILLELCGRDNVIAASRVGRYRVENDEGVVLAEIQSFMLIASVARRRHVLLISSPGEVFFLQQVDDGGVLGGNSVIKIILQPEKIACDCRHIIGLGWMGDPMIVGECNTVWDECLQVVIGGSQSIVLIVDKSEFGADPQSQDM